MRKFTLSLFLTLIAAQSAIATPPIRRTFTHKQSNGEVLTVRKHGDGHFVMYTLENGMPLLANDQGDLCYVIERNGRAVASTTLASVTNTNTKADFMTSSADVATLLQTTFTPALTPNTRTSSALNSDGLGSYGRTALGSVNSIGAPTIPVIMVEFSDKTFAEGTTPEKLSRLFNEKGYSDELWTVGSVKDYYEMQSFGLFTPSFEVVATVKLDKNYAYYGKNAANGSIDVNSLKFVKEAIQKATDAGVDFSKYATNGELPLVSLYYAGAGEHSAFEAGCEDYLWAHYKTMSNTTIGGVKFNSYFVGNELFQSYYDEEGNPVFDEEGNPVVTGAQIDGIGIFCHEFSHALGLPDFYYTGSDASVADNLLTMDFWSLMDYGQYAYDGYAPVPYTAYERNYLGWLALTELTDDMKGEVVLNGIDTENNTPKAYILRNPANYKEYYILENRQASTWHPAFLGSGMLVLHVDYDAAAWKGNKPNNVEYRQRMSYVSADGQKQNRQTMKGWNDYKGDLYPGIAQNFNLTSTSLPAATMNTGGVLDKPIYDISETDGIITFYYLQDKETTGINAPLVNMQKAPAYDLRGRRIYSPAQRGVYIQNGMKLVK